MLGERLGAKQKQLKQLKNFLCGPVLFSRFITVFSHVIQVSSRVTTTGSAASASRRTAWRSARGRGTHSSRFGTKAGSAGGNGEGGGGRRRRPNGRRLIAITSHLKSDRPCNNGGKRYRHPKSSRGRLSLHSLPVRPPTALIQSSSPIDRHRRKRAKKGRKAQNEEEEGRQKHTRTNSGK